ncbi:sporulation protein YunB [Paenibacillus selenitireducens]|uniref:Sporulation protein YunB n=1 Tax=Paenibacillus selenitireducens TaxID=1324314 RepID=A0A1T2XJC9_9BACL|nr:sporulation protein YunB [Paenibacillus selenitireducens]OPA79980.1 sporulation protein YunB [Paenibacillus selenitireducens]
MQVRRRWRSSSKKPGSRRKLFFISLVIFTLLTLQSFIFIEKNLKPPIMALAKIRVKQIATQSINKAISEQIANSSNFQSLIDWKTDRDGKVAGFMMNYAENMRITSRTKDVVESTLMNMKDLNEHIPLGQAFDSAIIASFGPKVPIRLEPQGAVKVELNTKQQDAGINMILVEVYIRIVAEVSIIIPFDTEPEAVETEIPVSYLLVVGNVPMYYYDNKGNPVGNNSAGAPNLAIPAPSSTPPTTTTPTVTTPDSTTTVVTEPQKQSSSPTEVETHK